MDTPALKRLLGTPTAPFRESQIRAFFGDYLSSKRVPYFEDSYGNIVVGAADVAQYRTKLARRSTTPLKVIVAHMDHPGFHAKKRLASRRLSFVWHGGSPTKDLNGARVWLSSNQTPGKFFRGAIKKPVMNKRGSAIVSGEIVLDARSARALSDVPAKEIFGGFGFRAPVWQKGKFLYTKAADDLIGAFSVASVAAELYSRSSRDRDNFIGLLTRAEEVGFIGMIEHLEQGFLTRAKREVVVLSLEASRTLERARIGQGPVVRLGDRSSVFDPAWNHTLVTTAQKVLKKRHQKRVMDGGSCEATAAIVYGLKAVGISVPLGNYHNMNLEGGPDASKKAFGPAPEYVHIDDVKGQIRLARAFVGAKLSSNVYTAARQRFRKSILSYRKLA